MRRVPVAGPTVSLMGAGVDLVDGTLSLLAIHQLCWVRATYYEQRILHTPLTWGSLATGAHWYWIRPFDHPAPECELWLCSELRSAKSPDQIHCEH